MENIDNFNKYTVVCLARLYKSFPVPIILKPDSLVIEVIGEEKCWEEDITANTIAEVNEESEQTHKQKTDLFREHIEIARSTVSWLENCGYIQMTKASDLDGQLYVLSPRGLEILSVVPDSLQPNPEALGDKILHASNNVAGESGKALLTKTIGELVGYAFKASIGA